MRRAERPFIPRPGIPSASLFGPRPGDDQAAHTNDDPKAASTKLKADDCKRAEDAHERFKELLEYRSDMLLSTLERFVQATGGELHLVVRYPDGAPVELLVPDE